MPPVTDPHNVYAAAGAGMLSEAARAAKPLVYVPHTKSRDVWVIDPSTFVVVARYPMGPASCSTSCRRGTCTRSTPPTTRAIG